MKIQILRRLIAPVLLAFTLVAAGCVVSDDATTDPHSGGGELLELNKEYTETLAADATNVFKFKTTTATTYTIITSSDKGLHIYAYDNGNNINFNIGDGLIGYSRLVDQTPDTVVEFEVMALDSTELTFTMTVLEGEGKSEGTEANPIPLTIGTPHTGTIAYNSSSYYAFTAERSGSYLLNVEKVDVLPDVNFLENTVAGFTKGTTYPLEASIYDALGKFTITVNQGNSLGSTLDPVPLTLGAATAGSNDADGYSYYKFTTGAAGGYTIGFGTTANAWTYFYGDLNDSGTRKNACNMSSAATCSPTTLLADTTYYVLVFETGGTDITYDLTVSGPTP